MTKKIINSELKDAAPVELPFMPDARSTRLSQRERELENDRFMGRIGQNRGWSLFKSVR
ncbi:hypothetical protein [Chelativorans petroleitrophicus]|uniref:hypothetical protein n=1 Tax=Chelativorans petroleitrophicus TaxID=2975484 RepID=UPI0021BE0878|nr:hypothetical protein [Chelativorans petroleitrophicus]